MGVGLSSRQTKISSKEAFQRKNGSKRSSLLCLLLCLCDSCNIPTLWRENNNQVPTNQVPNNQVPANKVPNNKEVPNAPNASSALNVPANEVSNNKEVPNTSRRTP